MSLLKYFIKYSKNTIYELYVQIIIYIHIHIYNIYI